MAAQESPFHIELQAVIDSIVKRPRTLTLEMIAEGADVSTNWLSTLSRGNIPDPSFNRVMRVRDYLRSIVVAE